MMDLLNPKPETSSSSLLLSCLELSDTQVREPQIRALLGTALHFCKVVVLKLRTPQVDRGSGAGDATRADARARQCDP